MSSIEHYWTHSNPIFFIIGPWGCIKMAARIWNYDVQKMLMRFYLVFLMKIWLSFWLKFLTALFWRKISDFNPRTCAQQAEPALRTELLCFDVKFTRQNLNFDLARFFFQIAKITQTNPLKFELAGYKNCYLKMTFPYLEMEDQSILRWRRLQMGIAMLQSFRKIKVHIFWEGHKIWRNLHLTFDWHYIGQK